ncbi:integrator complex subunit 5-like [Dreissena polymorpha]|uniref:integrator complex subunit 5-like n=1 Tax=Dreissena polymorpha TaxID=45954 RepID=UPI002263CBE7|nr:integrator complex subunit 5-like [Dreissena polymorpha]
MATAAESANSSGQYNSNDILKEVRHFIHGASHKVLSLRQRETLSQSALVLLRNLPTARYAVLEYIANVFDEAVNNYLVEIDVGQGVSDGSSQAMESFLHDACGILHGFLQTNYSAWAPIISTWSLELLGHISSKYSDRRCVPQRGSLMELLQLWLTCKPTKLLIEVATQCFSGIVSAEAATYVDALLEASVKFSPHFDWVVAHIGSAFPKVIITRVLLCGIKDYSQHGMSAPVESRDTKIPKMGSVVGILGHLANKHGHYIRDALIKLFQEGLEEPPSSMKPPMLPFLLQLASMSTLLLQILAAYLVQKLSASVLNQLHNQLKPWVKNYPGEFKSMMSLVVHLVIQNDTGADKVLDFLFHNATLEQVGASENTELPLPEIQNTCAMLIDQVLDETQMQVYRRAGQEVSAELPYLGALSTSLPTLTKQLLMSSGKRSKWQQRLICYIILYKGPKVGAEILAYILSHAETQDQLGQFIHIQQNIEMGMGSVLSGCVQCVMDLLHNQKDVNKPRLLSNLYTLTQWERTVGSAIVRCTFKHCLQSHWASLTPLLLHTDLDLAVMTLNILNYVTLPSTLSSAVGLQAAGSLVALFFSLLEIEDTRRVDSMVQACGKCASLLSRKPYLQTMLVRYLIEGAMENENKPLLGGKHDLEVSKSGSRDSTVSLRQENKKHGLSLTMLRSHSTVFHAGVIGQGLREKSNVEVLHKEILSRNQLYFEEFLWRCCNEPREVPNSPPSTEESTEQPMKSYRLHINADLCRTLGSLITELATPDVLYNNRFWPEEESLKMTVERDLHVWKHFDDNPVLYGILLLLAGNTLVMSRCSAVLKSLTATMMHHFEVSREKMSSSSPKQLQCAQCVIRCLGKSGLLPLPLSFLSELLPLLSSYEVYLLLLVVWRFMKENPPTEDPNDVSKRACESKHLEVLRSILHSNIDVTGEIYARFFLDKSGTDTKSESEIME